MKKNLLTFILVIMTYQMYSQNKENTIRKIDSLFQNSDKINYLALLDFFSSTKKIIIDTIVFDSINNIFFPTYKWETFQKNNLNAENEIDILDYIALKRFDLKLKYINFSFALMYSLGINSKKNETRRRTVNYLLDIVNLTPNLASYLNNFYSIDFDSIASERIKDILRGNKNKMEMEIYLFNEIREYKNNNISLLKRIKYKKFIKERFKYNIPKELFLTAGKLYMFDFSNDLNQMLQNPKYSNYKNEIRYALARLGDTIIEQQLFNDPNCDYIYINSKNSRKKYIENYLNSEKYEYWSNGEIDYPISYSAYKYLQKWIINFPEEFKIINGARSFNTKDIETYKIGKKWINDNFDNLEFDIEIW